MPRIASPASCSLAAACRPATPAPTTTTSACPCCAAALKVADRAAERCCGLLAGVKGRRGSLAAGQRASGAVTEGWTAATTATIVRSGNGWPLLGVVRQLLLSACAAALRALEMSNGEGKHCDAPRDQGDGPPRTLPGQTGATSHSMADRDTASSCLFARAQLPPFTTLYPQHPAAF